MSTQRYLVHAGMSSFHHQFPWNSGPSSMTASPAYERGDIQEESRGQSYSELNSNGQDFDSYFLIPAQLDETQTQEELNFVFH